MRVQELDPRTADQEAWQTLADAAAEPNPFFEPAFLLPAVRHLAGGDRVRLLVASGEDGWLAAMPLLPGNRWRGVPARVRGAWAHPYGFLGAPLAVAGPAGAEALDALLRAARRRAGFVPLEFLPAGGAADVAARAQAPATVWHAFERAALHRRPADDYEQGTLSSKHRRELRRQRRLLSEQVGEVAVRSDPSAAGVLVDLEAAGWKGENGTALRTVGHEGFFREACDAFAARGRLELLLLDAGDRTVAAKVNLLAGDGVFCFKIAFDEELSRLSPGVQLEVENIRWFHARPELQWMDSCADPSNTMINRLWPDRRAITSLLLAGSGMLGRAGRAEAALLKAANDRRTEGATA